ncbi:putative bifunctional diguanylate cyclase/phosphodiesterase [Nocardioides panacisoli]|uniref:EAL domain-containing protein n=1 Tax=Nocardioides panacisoli TaxID=627624 RepID=A0ABP7J6M3_9ACTN
MTALLARFRTWNSWWFDLAVCTVAAVVLSAAVTAAARDSFDMPWQALAGIPLILVVARFPIILETRDGGIEVGFDSSILMFLLCTLDIHDALVAWGAGVLLTQLTSAKRPSAKLFNIGVGIVAGWMTSVALTTFRGTALDTPRELAAVAVAAATYFATDYVLSAVTVSLRSGSRVRRQLLQPGSLLAVGCFVPFDTLGYLAAVVQRTAPAWMLVLLAVPLVTLLVATRALTRGRENARRLSVLFDAAVRAQTLTDREQVERAVVEDAARLLRLEDVELRSRRPRPGEVGAEFDDGDGRRWIVARAMERARSTVDADRHALQALAAVASDALARLAITREKVHVARHDPLTDLPNRGILLDRTDQALTRARQQGTSVALLFVDLDGFKPVNDRFGHAAGDDVLVEVAGRIRRCIRDTDTAARLGGDEFAVLLEDVDLRSVVTMSERVLATIREGVVVAGQLMPLSASAGLAYADSRDTGEGLLGKADLAMYEAKARGKDCLVPYQHTLGESRMERLVMVEDLRRAIAESRIDVVYQPVVATASGLTIGVEALARWDRNGRAVSPDVFIRLAEDAGLIIGLGDVVLAKVREDAAVLRRTVPGTVTIGVNISAQQLRDPSFVERIGSTVTAMGSSKLVLEITEREGILADEGVLAAMHAIGAMGVSFAIDDFGVGFSSVSYLQQLPVQIVKTDGSLATTIDTDERACALLRSVTLMGRALGIDVVVEGIERESQLAEIAPGEGLYVQGYLLHRPMSVEQLVAVLQAERGTSAA